MKNNTFHEDFQPQNCPLKSQSPQMAATLGAGSQVYDLNDIAYKHKAVMVGGADAVRFAMHYWYKRR